jgi:hypothetical protein
MAPQKIGIAVAAVSFLFSFLGFAAPPVALDAFFTTLRDTPVQVVLTATDEDIDPDHPEVHPLVFAIVTPPAHGSLSGDITAVKYEEPHKATVLLTYTPERGFIGTDSFTFIVTDPLGLFATGVVRIDVARPPAPPPTLSGSIDTYVTLDSSGVKDFGSNLTLFYIVDIFRFEAYSSWTLTGWNSFSLVGGFPLLDVARVRSTLAFNPAGPSFSYWQTDTSFSLSGLDVTHTFYLASTPASSYAQFLARGRVNGVSFTSTIKFGLVNVAFQSFSLSASFTGPCCGLSTKLDFSFTKEGFDYVTLTVSRIPLPGITCPSLAIYMNLEVNFTTVQKELDLSFTVDTLWQCCFRLLAEIENTGATLTGLNVYGIEMKLTLDSGIELRAATSFDPNKNSSVTGYTEYFEVLMFTGPILSCCGAPGRWQMGLYFEQNGALFGWGQTRILLDFSLSPAIRPYIEHLMKNDGTWELKLGLRVSW